MTISVGFTTVTSSIAALSVSGVTIKDVDKIPDAAMDLCPIMFPRPDNFVTDISPAFESFGSNLSPSGAPKINLTYTLNYVFLQTQAGGGQGEFQYFSGLISNIASIMAAIMSNDAITGAVDLQMASVPNIGLIEDPSGNQFWGCFLAFRVLEYVQ